MSERDVRAEITTIQAAVERGDTCPLPENVGPFVPTGQVGAVRWIALSVVALVGGVLFAALSGHGPRAALSYLGGLCAAVVAFEFGVLNIRVVDRYAPQLTLAAAVFSYVVTALAFALLLAASSPRVVDASGIALGLGAGLTVWLASLLFASRVRKGQQ